MWMIWLTLACSATAGMAHVTFTNLKCECFDKNFCEIESCHIKAVNRSHKYIDIYVNMKRLPVTKAQVRIEPMRYDNGYHPFLLGMTFDVCKYLKNPMARSMIFIREFHQTFLNSSNMNHTCPYDHDLVVDKLFTGNLEMGLSRYLPIPNGDYAIYVKWYTPTILRGVVNIYFKISK